MFRRWGNHRRVPPVVSAVELDFAARSHRTVDAEEIHVCMEAGRFVWVDVEFEDPTEARGVLSGIGLVSDEVIDDAVTGEAATQHARYPEYLHLVVSGCRQRGDQFDLERVDAAIGQRFMLTVHRGPVVFLQAVKRDYAEDFRRYAQSPSFLIYELWDHLLENYLAVQKQMERRVEGVQQRLIGRVDDALFSAVSELGADLLHFRKVVLPARAVLSDLATRKSIFISDATQPFLANMVGTVEHVLQDLLVDRDILAESLNLYMSMVGHRTNEVMKRLTVVSVVFLPLTFLCGVYGMNFQKLPELEWSYGYLYFWLVVLGLTASLLTLLKRRGML
jgi:magnesium transporter